MNKGLILFEIIMAVMCIASAGLMVEGKHYGDAVFMGGMGMLGCTIAILIALDK
jgi:hypothetical protein